MKLHVGGIHTKEGWKILSIQQNDGVDFIGDIADLSQFDDGSIEAVYDIQVLEDVPQGKALAALKGIHRALTPGGRFYVSVPDLDILSHTLINPPLSPQEKFHVMRMMFGGQTDEFDFHYFGWNELFLTDFLLQAGFSEAERVTSFRLFDDTSDYKPYGFPISLNVIASK